MPADTGFPRADVENDFQRARRRQILSRLAHRLRREPDDVNLILPFDDVVSALGLRGERELGLQTIRLGTGQKTIDAYVTEVLTMVPASGIRRRHDLLMKNSERMFRSRVPLPAQAYAKIVFGNPDCYAELGQTVEAWGYRYMQAERGFIDREQVARRWWAEEFVPVVRMLKAAELVGDRTDAEAYLRVARERHRLMRTQ